MSTPNKIDPIRERYYRILERVEKITDSLFLVSSALAIAAIFTDRDYPTVTSIFQLIFVVVVFASLVLDGISRFYLSPRGADARAKDFWAKVCDRPLTIETTTGYYNSDEVGVPRRLAAKMLENVFYTKSILVKMLWSFLPLAAGSVAALLGIWLYRGTSLNFIATATQVVLAEQICMKAIRMLWLKSRCERVYEDLQKLFMGDLSDEVFALLAFEYFTKYETSKALANVTLSDKVFEQLEPGLAAEWGQMKANLQIR